MVDTWADGMLRWGGGGGRGRPPWTKKIDHPMDYLAPKFMTSQLKALFSK